MGVFGNFTAKVQAGGKGSKGEDYVLDECLVALDMSNNGVPREVIATLLRRSKDSLNYKIFEKQTTIKGKTQVRSILRHMYVTPDKKGGEFRSEEDFLKRLFKSFDQEYKGEADIEARILAYCEANEIEIPEGEEQEESDAAPAAEAVDDAS